MAIQEQLPEDAATITSATRVRPPSIRMKPKIVTRRAKKMGVI